jgi:quinol---cytochrome-c reductase cytochrome c subunit
VASLRRCTQSAIAGLVLALATLGAGNDEGARLYAVHCATCHGARGEGSTIAPSLAGKSAADVHLMLDTGRMPAGESFVNEVHVAPVFTFQQMDRIVDYVESLSPQSDRSLPQVALGPGDIRRGGKLFIANCAPCHGTVGQGDSVGQDNVAPALGSATTFQVVEAIRAGPSVMPRFGRDVLSDRDVSDIARYVNYVQTAGGGRDSTDPGGFTLAHVGPVAEGFVAWFFGIGFLVLFLRGIGSTE